MIKVLEILHDLKISKRMTERSWNRNKKEFFEIFGKDLDKELLMFEMISSRKLTKRGNNE